MPIDPTKEYTAREIARYGYIQSQWGTTGDKAYRAIKRLVQFGKLKSKALAYGRGGIYYLVKGSDIIEYLKVHPNKNISRPKNTHKQ